MKPKFFIILLTLTTIILAGHGLYSQTIGDVNNDSAIDIIDALLVAQYYVDLNPPNFNPDAADVDAIGQIDIVDALLIAQYYVGLISEFPGQTQTPAPTPTLPVSTDSPLESPQPPSLPGNWQLVFQDEFEGNQLDASKWSKNYPWGNTHNHRAYMDPANVNVENGLLRIKAENKRHPDAPDGIYRDDFGWLSLDYTSGCVTTSGKFHIRHGYIEGRLKMPPTKGFWPAFWTLSDGWPPEIDIMEFLSSVQTRFYTNYHWGEPEYGSHFVEHSGPDLTAGFHVFAVEWDSNHMTWYLNGNEIARFESSYCSQAVNQYILLNLAVGGWEEDPDGSTSWPGWYECDWVRVWQKQ
ncbi:MAG: family 16 glycosylhydrolase [Spirochaetales bacterium]|nr:family 16 glycosylhydrolase [Spirochaetales bacterium]